MKETFKNIKRVYSYGKKFKFNLFCETLGSTISGFIGIIIPIWMSKQLVYLTNNSFEELLYATIIILILHFINTSKTVLIRYSKIS